MVNWKHFPIKLGGVIAGISFLFLYLQYRNIIVLNHPLVVIGFGIGLIAGVALFLWGMKRHVQQSYYWNSGKQK